MSPRLPLLFVASMAASAAAQAGDSCAVQAASLMAQSRLSELAAMFVEPSESIERGLAQLFATIGPIETVAPLPHATSGATIRKSVALTSLPSSDLFQGNWARLTTPSGQTFEIQASAKQGSDCRLLALHVDQRRK